MVRRRVSARSGAPRGAGAEPGGRSASSSVSWSGSGSTAPTSTRPSTRCPPARCGWRSPTGQTVRTRLEAPSRRRRPDKAAIETFMSRAYDSDFSAASSIDESAAALQENFGFGPGDGAVGGVRPEPPRRDDGAGRRRRRRLRRARRQPALAWATSKPEGRGRGLEGRRRPGRPDRPDHHPRAAVRRAARRPAAWWSPATTPATPPRRRGRPRATAPSLGDKDGIAALADRLGEPANAMRVVRRLRLRRPGHVAGRRGRPGAGRAARAQGRRRHAAGRAGHGDGAGPDPARGRALRGLRAGAEEPAAAGAAGGRGGRRARRLASPTTFRLTGSQAVGSEVRARPRAARRRRASCSPRCTTARCCSRPAEVAGLAPAALTRPRRRLWLAISVSCRSRSGSSSGRAAGGPGAVGVELPGRACSGRRRGRAAGRPRRPRRSRAA